MMNAKNRQVGTATPQPEEADDDSLRSRVATLESDLAAASDLAASREKELGLQRAELAAATEGRQSAQKELVRVRGELESSCLERSRISEELSLTRSAREQADRVTARLETEVCGLEDTVVELKQQRDGAKADASSERGARQASQ